MCRLSFARRKALQREKYVVESQSVRITIQGGFRPLNDGDDRVVDRVDSDQSSDPARVRRAHMARTER